ncbi:MAG: hypothetical protein RLP44_16205 [Aggregatilineales bacterium]
MGRRKSKKRDYKLIGFKAYADTDADLLAWWESISVGQRSDALRDLLRLALGYHRLATKPDADLSQVVDDIAWMRDALTELPGYVERVIQHVAVNAVVVQPENRSASDTIGDDAARRREERMKRRQW